MDKRYRAPKKAITEKGLKRLLRDAFRKEGSASQWAEKNGITTQVVSAFMRGVQSAGLQIPEAFGYRPQTVYLPVDEPLITTPLPQRKPTANPSKKTDPTKPPVHKLGKEVDEKKETKKRLKEKNKKNKKGK